MKMLLSRRKLFSLFSFVLTLFLISCGSPANVKKGDVSNASSRPPGNSGANQGANTPYGILISQVCSLPKAVGGSSPLADLGGGTWGKWDNSGGENDYGCNGGKDSVKLEQETAKMSAFYGAFGSSDNVHYVFAKYAALQYGGKTPVEGKLRRNILILATVCR